MLGLQPPHTKWPLTQWKICFGGAISSKHTWTQKWKIGKSLKILIYRTLRRLDPGSPLSHLEVPHGLLQNFKIWFFSNSLPLQGKKFLHRDSSTFKAANSAWTCSLVPGISDKIVFWLPSLNKVMRIFLSNFYTFCHIAGPFRGRFFLSARGWGVG